MSTEPPRPTAVETVLYEPDRGEIIAVLPGALWLQPGDIVELDQPPREARVLSSRLQLRGGEARVLIVLDVPDDPDAARRGANPAELVLGAALLEPSVTEGLADALDEALEQLADEVDLDPAPDGG